MATCRDIITRALQQARIVPLGRQPSDKEAEVGLVALQGIYDGWFANGMFGTLKDVDATGTYEASEGDRVTGATTVTKPTQVDDGCSPTGKRPPYELSAIVDVDAGENWLWSSGAWVNCSGLALGDNAPLSERDREGLSSYLAIYLAEGFGQSVGPMTAQRGLKFVGSVSHKFGSTQASQAAEFF